MVVVRLRKATARGWSWVVVSIVRLGCQCIAALERPTVGLSAIGVKRKC